MRRTVVRLCGCREWPGWLRRFVGELPELPARLAVRISPAAAEALAHGTSTAPAAHAYDFGAGLWPSTDSARQLHAGLTLGEPQKQYVLLGHCYSFPHPHACPFDGGVGGSPAALWWDPDEPSPRVLVQLGPQFPPLLWLPLVPSAGAIQRLLGDIESNDAKFLEANAGDFERAIDSGVQLLEGGGQSSAVVPWAEAGAQADLYRRTASEVLPHMRVRKEHESTQWYWLGDTQSAEDTEREAAASPFLFGRWPSVVVGGAQRRQRVPVLASVFRTVYSKSVLYFSTREDEPYASHDLRTKTYKESVGLYCCVSHPDLPRLSGGEAVVERYNRIMGCDYPLTTPVDVLGALALWRVKAPSQVAAEYEVAAGSLFDVTADVVAEVARRQREQLDEEGRRVAERLAASTDGTASPAILRVCGYIRRLAVMQHPEFEDLCFKPLMLHESGYVRAALHEASLLRGRQDLADLILAREPDERVVRMIADVNARQA